MREVDKFRFEAAAIAAIGSIHIPKMSLLSALDEGRFAGTGGGGQALGGGTTPHFCKVCGKTVSRKKVKPSCDVCSRCRSRGRNR